MSHVRNDPPTNFQDLIFKFDFWMGFFLLSLLFCVVLFVFFVLAMCLSVYVRLMSLDIPLVLLVSRSILLWLVNVNPAYRFYRFYHVTNTWRFLIRFIPLSWIPHIHFISCNTNPQPSRFSTTLLYIAWFFFFNRHIFHLRLCLFRAVFN